MKTLWQDVTLSLRLMARNPLFMAPVVLTLALGIGALSTIFSVVYGILLRPLPFSQADRLVALWQTDIQQKEEHGAVSPASFLEWQERARGFAGIAAAEPYSYGLTDAREPTRIQAWLVTENFFQVLGAPPLAGRIFTSEAAGGAPANVAVLSHGLWRRLYGADPAILGKPVRLDGNPYTVIGVMPPEFAFPPGDKEMWVPRRFEDSARQVRGRTSLRVVGRARPDVSLPQLRREMDTVAATMARDNPGMTGMGVAVVPLDDELVGKVRPALLLLLVAAALLLVIASVNVMNLLLVRNLRRERELATRAALGATRARLARQALTEAVLLTSAGGCGGLLLTYWGIVALRRLGPSDLPRLAEVRLDHWVVLFAAGVSLLTAGLVALAPLFRMYRSSLRPALDSAGDRQSGAGTRTRYLQYGLLVAEVAFSLMLLIGAGLVVRTFVNLVRVDLGFSPRGVATLEAHIWSQYKTEAARAQFFRLAEDRIAAVPGVWAAGAASAVPFAGGSERLLAFQRVDRPAAPPADARQASLITATSGYLRALGVPVLRGRFFNPHDGRDSVPVAVINKTMAARFWPGEDPLGRKIEIELSGRTSVREIVGVVGDVRVESPDGAPRPELYVPHAQYPFGSMTFVARGADAPRLLQEVKREVWRIDRGLTFARETTLEQRVFESLAVRRLSLLLLGSFAAAALSLVAIGIYALLSFSVSQRSQELGIRIALGASRSQLLRVVLSREARLVAAGLVLGMGCGVALTRFLKSQLFGVEPIDPLTFTAVSVLMIAVAILAIYVPAQRALRLDPTASFRH